MSDTTQTQSIEQTLNKTDFGHMVYEYRKILLGLLLAILLGVTGLAIWKQTQESRAMDNSVAVFEFQNEKWQAARADKISSEELVEAFENLPPRVQTSPVMVPVVLEMGKHFHDKGEYEHAHSILSRISLNDLHSFSAFFLGMQHSAVLEKINKQDEAIAVMERLAKSKDVFMPARVYLELGRLYLEKGEKGQAQGQFDYVINTYPNETEARVAKLYLSQLAQ